MGSDGNLLPKYIYSIFSKGNNRKITKEQIKGSYCIHATNKIMQ